MGQPQFNISIDLSDVDLDSETFESRFCFNLGKLGPID